MSLSQHSLNERLTGTIAWFARNGVAANLLMVFIVVAGYF